MAITFNSVTLPLCKSNRGATEVSIKEIVFPGVHGIEEMNIGQRGRTITCSGRITDNTNGTFNSEIIDGWMKNRTKSTLDLHGTAITGVVVDDASTGTFYTTTDGKMGCTYSITFKKLK